MKQQNFKNHTRILFSYHIVTGLAAIALFIGAIRNVIHADKSNLYSASLILLIAIVLISIFWYARVFALKAQDRAIRAEENFRFYILTGKPLDVRLRLGQIIALRFASNEELPSLAQKALDNNLSPKKIKMEIKNWRADHHRV